MTLDPMRFPWPIKGGPMDGKILAHWDTIYRVTEACPFRQYQYKLLEDGRGGYEWRLYDPR